LLGERGQLEEAVSEIRQALELVPNDADLHSNLARLLADQGKLEQAMACCAESLRLIPDQAAFHDLKGLLLPPGEQASRGRRLV